MVFEKNILKIIPGLQATALVGHNLKAIKNPLKVKSMTKLAMTNILGVSLIKPTAELVNKF